MCVERRLGKRQVKWQMGHEGRHGGKLGGGMLQGKSWEQLGGRDAFRIRRVWTGVWEDGYPGDRAVRGQALGLSKDFQSVVRGAQGCVCVHLEGISALFPIE